MWLTWPQIAVVLARKDLPRVPWRAELGAGVPGADVGSEVSVVVDRPLGGVDVLGNGELRAVSPPPVGVLVMHPCAAGGALAVGVHAVPTGPGVGAGHGVGVG